MTRVYINWETQEVVGAIQAEEIIERKQKEYMDDPDTLEEYLYDNFTILQVWEMPDDQRYKVMSEFSDRQREYANAWFENEFFAYEIE